MLVVAEKGDRQLARRLQRRVGAGHEACAVRLRSAVLARSLDCEAVAAQPAGAVAAAERIDQQPTTDAEVSFGWGHHLRVGGLGWRGRRRQRHEWHRRRRRRRSGCGREGRQWRRGRRRAAQWLRCRWLRRQLPRLCCVNVHDAEAETERAVGEHHHEEESLAQPRRAGEPHMYGCAPSPSGPTPPPEN